jgi:hypothetical protein
MTPVSDALAKRIEAEIARRAAREGEESAGATSAMAG